jgi:hypothetical protein
VGFIVTVCDIVCVCLCVCVCVCVLETLELACLRAINANAPLPPLSPGCVAVAVCGGSRR